MVYVFASTQWPIACHTKRCKRQHLLADTGLARPPLNSVHPSGMTHRLQHSQKQQQEQHQRIKPLKRSQQCCRAERGENGWPHWARGDGWPGSLLRPPGDPDSQHADSSAKLGSRDDQHSNGAAEQPTDSGWQQNWDGWDQDWDDWESMPSSGDQPMSKREKYERMASRRGPRDAYLRPMIDKEGIRQRFTWNADEGEEALRMEFEVNQFESREAVKFAGEFLKSQYILSFIEPRANLLTAGV